MKGEQDTVEDVAKAQCADIERYLQKEIAILDDIQKKADKKQKNENQRFLLQIGQVRQISSELDASRVECVKAVVRVEQNLGIQFDSNESFQVPMHEKMQEALMSRGDNIMIDRGNNNAQGIITMQGL